MTSQVIDAKHEHFLPNLEVQSHLRYTSANYGLIALLPVVEGNKL